MQKNKDESVTESHPKCIEKMVKLIHRSEAPGAWLRQETDRYSLQINIHISETLDYTFHVEYENAPMPAEVEQFYGFAWWWLKDKPGVNAFISNLKDVEDNAVALTAEFNSHC